jgi:hypothetical protein
MIEVYFYPEDFGGGEKSIFKYNTKRNPIECRSYSADGRLRSIGNKFDDKGNLIQTTYYSANGSTSVDINKYDDKENLIESIHYSTYTVINKIIFKYVYDKKLNWIKKTSFLDDRLIDFRERVIVYY